MSALHTSRLNCDLCPNAIVWDMTVSLTGMRVVARQRGWRRDKLNRDICSIHPKLKGARA